MCSAWMSVAERIDRAGNVVVALDEQQARSAIRSLRAGCATTWTSWNANCGCGSWPVHCW